LWLRLQFLHSEPIGGRQVLAPKEGAGRSSAREREEG